MTRRKTPSSAVANGMSLGTAIGVVLEVAAAYFYKPLPPGAGALLGGAFASIVGYAATGGRKDEPG